MHDGILVESKKDTRKDIHKDTGTNTERDVNNCIMNTMEF